MIEGEGKNARDMQGGSRSTTSVVGRWTSMAALAALLWPAALHAQSPEPAPGPALAIAPLEGITLDGRLDEAAWATADSIARITEVEPEEGGVPPGRTVIKVLADADALVIGVAAYQPPGIGIVSFAKAPDSELRNEDHVRIVLDTFLDGRSGYVFSVNPSGARYDALVSIQGGANSSWDGVWDAATRREGAAWFAEIWIPIRTLTFAEGLDRWGFNVERRIQALQETDRWAGASVDYQVDQTSRAGNLVGLPPFELGLGLSVRPSVTTGGGTPAPDSALDGTLHPSLDVTQTLGSNLLASLTVNTDFAETEVDTRRTNFTRFPLFFPEKRSFFLEGSDIFEFGSGGQNMIPFFSRRIGLVDGTSVPLDVGAKMNGRIGETSIGALVTRTRDRAGLGTDATMGVVRLRQNVLEESSLGVIGSFGDPLARNGSWMLGSDARFQTSRFAGEKNLSVGLWALVMDREALKGDRTAAGLRVAYPNDLVNASASYVRIGESFDPSLGFVPRSGVHLANLEVNWQPRPGRVGPLDIRQCFWENRLSYVGGLSGGWQSYRVFMAPVNCRLESGDRFEGNVVPQGERLLAPFEVANGVTVPVGSYHFIRYRLEAGLAPKRPLSAQLTWWFGGFYDGTLHQIQLRSTWNLTSLLILEVNGEHDIGHMTGGNFTADLWGVRLNANVSPNLQLSSFAQYDTEGRLLGTNTRLRWTFSPLGALFLVYNHNLSDADSAAAGSWSLRRLRFDSNQLLVKAQYVLRY